MINNITIKEVATYDDSGVSLDALKKVNYIYGSNGSGKTTISNFIKNQEDKAYKKCGIEYENFEDYEIHVYNRFFKEEHFKQDDLPGVFTIGKVSIDEQQLLDEKKQELTKLKQEQKVEEEKHKKNIGNIENSRKEFDTYIWQKIKKEYENIITDSFSGFKGSQKSFSNEIIRRFQVDNTSTLRLEYDDLIREHKQLYEFVIQEQEEIYIDKSIIEEILNVEEEEIWEQAIVGNEDVQIAQLINKFNNSDWVNRGKQYLNGSTCPFCQENTITEEFISNLEKYFDETFKSNLEKVKKVSEKYCTISNQFGDKLMENLNDKKEFLSILDIDTSNLENSIDSLSSTLKDNCSKIENKRKEPALKVTLNTSKLLFDSLLNEVNIINKEIKEYNKNIQNIKVQRGKFQEKFWSYCILENEIYIDSYIKKERGLTQKSKKHKQKTDEFIKEIRKLNNEIIELESKMTSVESSINEINRSLKSFSFNNFEIVPSSYKNNAYQIQRPDGSLATNTLSEGEETFISFLYFMQLIKGSFDQSKTSLPKIVVIDDPISSLDSTVIYIVSAMIKNLIESIIDENGIYSGVDQLILLTHNVYFHKEVTNIRNGYKKVENINYWLLHKHNEITSITDHGAKNPILSSYELLWQELKNENNTNLITVQNIMRRILENYFSILGKDDIDYKHQIKDKFIEIEDKRIFESLVMWLNDGSHSIHEDLYIEQTSDAVVKYKDVFKNVFEKTGNTAHYNMMMFGELT